MLPPERQVVASVRRSLGPTRRVGGAATLQGLFHPAAAHATDLHGADAAATATDARVGAGGRRQGGDVPGTGRLRPPRTRGAAVRRTGSRHRGHVVAFRLAPTAVGRCCPVRWAPAGRAPSGRSATTTIRRKPGRVAMGRVLRGGRTARIGVDCGPHASIAASSCHGVLPFFLCCGEVGVQICGLSARHTQVPRLTAFTVPDLPVRVVHALPTSPQLLRYWPGRARRLPGAPRRPRAEW